MLDIIKDVITSVLVIICIIAVLAVIFYDQIPLSKVVPEAEEYKLSAKMQEELTDTDLEEVEEVIVSYQLDASDLKKYENNNEYDGGKSNPFAKYEASSDSNNITNNNSSSNTNNNSQNFYEDDGTK